MGRVGSAQAHLKESCMDRSVSASVAGYGVHSSKIITMSLPRSR